MTILFLQMIQGAILMNRRPGGTPLCSVDFENFRGLCIAKRNQISFINYVIFQMFIAWTVQLILSFWTVGFVSTYNVSVENTVSILSIAVKWALNKMRSFTINLFADAICHKKWDYCHCLEDPKWFGSDMDGNRALSVFKVLIPTF
jgi:hypothetical protein